MASFPILVCALYSGVVLVVCVGAWDIEPQVYTVYQAHHTWNEAREICNLNNNTFLTIPDTNYWELWKFLLNPESEASHRDASDSLYWFGLHAPDTSNLTSLFWSDCYAPAWIEWSARSYTPNQPCIAFDVYLKVFTTTLHKLWHSEPCSNDNLFVCSEPLNPTDGTCITYGCDEYVRVVTDKNSCTDQCIGQPTCRANYTVINGAQFCHVFHLVTYPNADFYRICLLPEGPIEITSCTGETWFEDLGTIVNVDMDPDGRCLNQPSTTERVTTEPTSTTDTTTTVAMTTTTSPTVTSGLQTTTPSSTQLCACRCIDITTSTLTVEEKVEQLKRELTVDKKNTSLHKRKFISVSDSRLSATGIGSLGVGILVVVLVAIFLMDLGTLKTDLTNMYHNVTSCCYKTGKDIHIRHVRHANSSESNVRLFTSSRCPVVVNTTSPQDKLAFGMPFEDTSKKGNLLTVPTNPERSQGQNDDSSPRTRSPSSIQYNGSADVFSKPPTDRCSNPSSGYQSSMSGSVSSKSLTKSRAWSSVNVEERQTSSHIQLQTLAGDRGLSSAATKAWAISQNGGTTKRRKNVKEPAWLRMV